MAFVGRAFNIAATSLATAFVLSRPRVMHRLTKICCMVWTLPNTLIGLLLGGVMLLSGGRVQLRRGCIEFYGGSAILIVPRLPFLISPIAMTLGHTILGQTAAALDITRDHEHVHVRQYEHWGPLFLFAYLGSSAWLWWIGKDAYHDNPFEIEAFSKVPSFQPKQKRKD